MRRRELGGEARAPRARARAPARVCPRSSLPVGVGQERPGDEPHRARRRARGGPRPRRAAARRRSGRRPPRPRPARPARRQAAPPGAVRDDEAGVVRPARAAACAGRNVSSRRAKPGSACTRIASKSAFAVSDARSSCSAWSLGRGDEDVAQAADDERPGRAGVAQQRHELAPRTSCGRTGTARRRGPPAAGGGTCRASRRRAHVARTRTADDRSSTLTSAPSAHARAAAARRSRRPAAARSPLRQRAAAETVDVEAVASEPRERQRAHEVAEPERVLAVEEQTRASSELLEPRGEHLVELLEHRQGGDA